ncbi:6-bladed beta-propeller [Catenovulum sediminis]|uniref:6-bladed beta-propeller n=1 Tax=Catenovulum sediminis TaxID=1740262 RepID=UPI001180EF64|nr:6-bladed beta-propeller [Catenovulum sediminis]
MTAPITNNLSPKENALQNGQAVGANEFKYKLNANWGVLDSNQYPVENCHDLAIDSQGRIIMVTDNTRNNFLIYSKDGELLDSFGTEFPGAHAVKIVQEGDEEFMYVVDSGWKLNRHWDGVSINEWDSPYNKVVAQAGFIAKVNMQGDILFTIGHPQTVGAYTPDMPFRPTDIAIADNGDLYVTDGYGSDYLIQYDKQGRYIRHWGGHDNQDENLNLANTHGVEIDRRDPNNPVLMVSSRAECAFKFFTLDGDYIRTLKVPGAWVGRPVFKGEHFYVPVCWSDINGKNEEDSGFIAIFDKNNQVVANIGGEQPVYQNGELQPMKTSWNLFNHCHGLCVDDDGNLYVGQWRANQSYPIKLERL